MKKLIFQFKYTLINRPFNIVFTLLLLIGMYTVVYLSQTGKKVPPGMDTNAWTYGFNWWANWLDPIIGVSTFLIAFGVWWANNKRAWESKLPKRLTIHYEYKGEEIMRCEEVYLSSAADIRPWAQQLGAQLSNTRFLKFEPFLKEETPVIKFDAEQKVYYQLFTAYLFLTERPKSIGLSEKKLKAYRRTRQYRHADGVVVWARNQPMMEMT